MKPVSTIRSADCGGLDDAERRVLDTVERKQV